ncbi:MAG: TrkA family potassium uptake protein [Magnetococcales bacterium]|nr:TrkA family potassium uptake protein [Magnetococcales bacterium]
MTQNFLVVGLGTFGRQAAKALSEGGAFVLAVDRDEERVNAIQEEVSKAVCCNALDQDAMNAIGAYDVDYAIVAIRKYFDVTVLATHALHKKGVAHILVQVDSEIQADAILAFGSTEVIFPQRDMALRIANKLLHPDLAEHIPLGSNVAMIEIPCPALFAGKTLNGLALRTQHGVSLIGLRIPASSSRAKENILLNPPPDTLLHKDHRLMLLGTLDQLSRIKAMPNASLATLQTSSSAR